MSVKPIRSSVQHLLSAAAVVVSYVAAVFISRYLRIEPESLVCIPHPASLSKISKNAWAT